MIIHFYLLMTILFTFISYASDPERKMLTSIIAGLLWWLGVYYILRRIFRNDSN
jgi:hypothetical protein